MKKFYILFLLSLAPIFTIYNNCHAATVGNPLDLDVPARSAVLRQAVIERTLEEYEQIVKIKTALDLEFVFKKDLHGPCGVGGVFGLYEVPGQEVSGAELKGQWYMVKLGTTIFNRIEPYIKIGSSYLQVKWKQNKAVDIEVEADYGFAWGGGIKVVIWDFDNWGIRLTGDGQYRTTEPDVSKLSLGNIGTIGSNIDPNVDFDIKEWQASLILSKKFELPLKRQSIYIVPYTGFSLSDSTVDVKVTNTSDPAQDWTLFDANNDSIYGFILGCDIMPSLTSSFTYSMELRLFNETALTLGGAMKF